ncbi:hypothetical protein CHS0354_034782 [Potamilus streckersoni]|uniref:Uncharacterized protein n=1 Tax=Potamilus streckersoni TaxID=2493646 RepID=A0AAE0VIM0_9BIVA|nr:hypothetical protein CHS0354_034782 [Potamilus streckersoni]
MEEMKRMRKDIVRLDEMIQSKDEKIKRIESSIDKAKELVLPLESDIHAMADVVKKKPGNANKGKTCEKKIVENENKTNRNRLSDKRNSPPRNHDMNTVNDMNTNSKPIQVRISNMAFSGVQRNRKTNSLLLSSIKAEYATEELKHVILRHAYN